MDFADPRTAMLCGALILGAAFGIVSRLSAFCFRSAVLETLAHRPGFQVVAWLAATAVAIALAQGLQVAEIVDLSGSIYLSQNLGWLPIMVGGVLFGIGMILARGCGGRHMILLAGGNLRSAVVISVLGIVAYMTLRGILALPRTALEDVGTVSIESLGMSSASLGAILGGDVVAAVVVLAAVAALIVLVLRRLDGRGRVLSLLTGAAIGITVGAGWYVTGVIGFDEFAPVRLESLTFTAPVGNAIQYLMTYTGATADFGIVAVAGVLLGAGLTALVRRDWNLQGFETPHQLLRYVAGGALMGSGGVLALGCTIGEGLSGVSTLSIGSFLALASIVFGALIGDLLVRRNLAPRAGAVQPAE